MKRREFMQKTAAGAAGAAVMYEMFHASSAGAVTTSRGMGIEEAMYFVERGKEQNTIPAVRPEILSNPRAVFLIETHVEATKDETGMYTDAVEQLREEGTGVARRLFVAGTQKGGSTFIKPNFTGVPEHKFHRTNGVYSSPDFIVGVVEHLREIGNPNVFCGDGPIDATNHRQGGVYDAFDPYEVNMIEAGYERFEHYGKNDLNWSKVDESLVWRQIPYIKPLKEPDNFCINIAKLKNHLTALTTLSVKNLQGCVPRGYGQFCMGALQVENFVESQGGNYGRHFQRNMIEQVAESFRAHRAAGFKRWGENTAHFGNFSRFEELGGVDAWDKVKDDRDGRAEFLDMVGDVMRDEMWINRGLDNAATLKPDLNIIEGIIGMDGNEHGWWEIGDDQLVNIVIAGCSPFEVDAVGSYIMGHDPNQIWYTRVAKEKGYGECDPAKIDIYRIRENGDIEPVRNIASLPRTRLGVNWARSENPSERLFW